MPKIADCEICGKRNEECFARFCNKCRRLVDEEFELLKVAAHQKAVENVKSKMKGVNQHE